MGFPSFFLGLSLPILAGIGLGYVLYQMAQSEAPQRTSSRKREESFYFEPPQRENICNICMSSIETGRGYPLNCGHEFHASCRSQIYQRKIKECPTCRRPIKYE